MKKQTTTVIITTVITTIIVIIGFILLMPIIGPRFIHPMMMGNRLRQLIWIHPPRFFRTQACFGYPIAVNSSPLPLNQIHSWTIHIETADGQPVEGAEILVDGGMPQHGHGLPTQPEVTEDLGNGDYRVEGMKFQMLGFWEVKFNINADGQSDNVTFNLILE